MACQMVPAVFDTVALELVPGVQRATDADDQHWFRANGSVLVEPGFMAVYQEGKDDSTDDDSDRLLPEVSVGDVINLDVLRPEQHFTEPPPRFSEARLVKKQEWSRPSRHTETAVVLGCDCVRAVSASVRHLNGPNEGSQARPKEASWHTTAWLFSKFESTTFTELIATSRKTPMRLPVK